MYQKDELYNCIFNDNIYCDRAICDQSCWAHRNYIKTTKRINENIQLTIEDNLNGKEKTE